MVNATSEKVTENTRRNKTKIDTVSHAKEVDEIGGYVTTKRVSTMLTNAIRQQMLDCEQETFTVASTIRLQYRQDVNCIKIGDILLFNLASVTAFIPVFIEERKQEKANEQRIKLEKEKKAERKRLLQELEEKYKH